MRFLKRILGGHGDTHRGERDGAHHDGHDARDRDRHGGHARVPDGDSGGNVPLRRLACAGCGALNAAGARFCAQCGASQRARACARCHAALVANARFCLTCGTRAGT
ncbi:zinc ribbon domain-containing protein [Burkholderia dolosa]|uniref:zinc ribbon domain-containing protein n=1 Tax=Burkholderia dolosa TaxID=152500 RepID=UPI001B995054|nr:zinc ribbon domain-containing protein [Burkholderia dolosa]MBR8312599.1 zinc ribbon domain-containing protein [Burkholderia dolosa]